MSAWDSLARLDLVVRPVVIAPPLGHRRSQFSAPIGSTVRLLATELRQLSAERIVLELHLRERDIRLDGLPRSDARPLSPAVVLAFDSKHGPIRMATGEFATWHDNLRAIALSMEALRAVDRYGVSKRGEQYRGWGELEAGPVDPADAVQTEEQAWAVIVAAAGIPPDSSPLLNGISQEKAVKMALHATAPDHGGDPDEFRKVLRAREILGLD